MSIHALLVFILASGLHTALTASRTEYLNSASVRGSLTDGERDLDPDDPARNGGDYWERLVGTPSRLSRRTKKEGVLPVSKYSMETFDVVPFQAWLRQYTLLHDLHNSSSTSAGGTMPPPPLSFVCGVWINPTYKFIFIRNRKTASSTFLTAVKKFMIDQGLCEREVDAAHSNNCVLRLEPSEVMRDGGDLSAMWRDYTVITSTRNPWARAASGYQFTYDKWSRREGGACAQPTFLQFCKDPFIMGKISNLFQCADAQREGVGQRHDGHWNFDFCHVEPAAPCMLDDDGKLVVDFVIRYERLEEDMQAAIELINERRPSNVPAIKIPRTVKWRNKGTVAKTSDINSTDAAAFVYAPRFRACGATCVDALADFYKQDLELFGWDKPGPPPSS